MTPWFVLTHKVLPLLVMPLGLVLVLVAWAVISKRRGLMVLAGATLWLSSAPITADTALHPLETAYPFLTVEEAPAADAIFVLGGIYGRRPNSQRGNWGEAVDRFETGLALFRAESAPVLVLSAGVEPSDGGPTEGDSLLATALERGFPPGCVVLTEPVRNTDAEARAIAEMMDRYGWGRVLLVTSAFHMPRAKMLFDFHGVSATAIPTDYGGGSCVRGVGAARIECWVPDAIALQKTQLAMREALGLTFYAVRNALKSL